MWTAKLSLEQLKTIIGDSISHLDFREFWMITWIDRIGLRDDGTPFVKVAIHRVRSGELTKFSTGRLDLKRPQWITIPLRLLRIFPVGTLFKAGMAMFRSHYSFIPSYTLDLDTSRDFEHTTLGRWKHGLALINTMSWRNLDRYNTEDNRKFAVNSKILVYPNFKTQRAPFDLIVFPATEVARFYWFSSTRLFRALMDGKASSRDIKNALYVPESAVVKTEDGEQYHEIIVRDTMHLRDTEFIARLAFSAHALHSANTIYQSVINADLQFGNVGTLHLDCEFPFRTDTSLSVHGYTVQLDNVDVLIVTELKQCYGPWPFHKLKYDRETPRGEVDPTLPKKGTKNVPKIDPEMPQENEDDEEDPDDPEDQIEGFILDTQQPWMKEDPKYDHNRKNNNRTKNVEYTDKGNRFPTIPKDKERLQRFRTVAPKKEREVKTPPIDNVSTNEKTTGGGTSTNVDIVTEEEKRKLRIADAEKYIDKVCKFLERKGAIVRYVRFLDSEDERSTDWHQQDQLSLAIPITEDSNIFFYLIYARIDDKEFILCEMDRELKSSIKIITKHKLNSDGTKSFVGPDMGIILQAIKHNYGTLEQLRDDTVEDTGFEVVRLYHMEGATEIQLGERILARVGYKDLTDN